MPTLPGPRRPAAARALVARRRGVDPRVSRPRIVVLGDLALDVVLAPARSLVAGSDVPGSVSLRQGGSAATTARTAALLGAASTLVTSVGRDPIGRALVADLALAGVVVRAYRSPHGRTGRIGVLVDGGERSFVADRSAADALPVEHVRETWFGRTTVLHLPAYSLLGEPLGSAARRAAQLAHAAGGAVSVDLASAEPLLARGRRVAVRTLDAVAPDLLFATTAEVRALAPRVDDRTLLDLAPIAIVKRGSAGASVLARRAGTAEVVRFDVATRPLAAGDPTGAGDAFDAGFLVVWAAAGADARGSAAVLRRAAVAGNAAAARYLVAARRELPLG